VRFESRRKKLRRLLEVRLELAGATGEVGDTADIGLFLSDGSLWRELPINRSRTAPAVLGRPSSSTVLREGRPARAGCGLEVVPPTIEDKLLVAEWPRIVDRDVSVSEEIVESGRMYSTLSEKPTRARDGGRTANSSSAFASRNEGCEMDLLNL